MVNSKSQKKILSLGMAEKAENIFWSFGDRDFGLRESNDEIFKDGVSCTDRPWGNLFQESLSCAAAIESQNSGPKKILYSGGLDSESVLSAFLRAKIQTEVLVFDFGFNKEEIFYAEKFCRENQVPLITHHFPVKNFWEQDLQGVSTKSGCVSPSICALLAAILEIDEYVIMGDGELDIFTFDGSRFYESRGERWAAARWLFINEHPGCPSFYRYTSELEAAFFFDPMIEDFQKAWRVVDHRWFSGLKYFLYYHYFGLRWRPKILGFRESPVWNDIEGHFRKELKKQQPGADSYCTMDFALMKKIKNNECSFQDLVFNEVSETGLSQTEKNYLKSHSKDALHWLALEK